MNQQIETIDPEIEPEYVGAHSALVTNQCAEWDTSNGYNRCNDDATHTVVMADGNGLHEIAMCDECGEPEDVDHHEREWAGELRE